MGKHKGKPIMSGHMTTIAVFEHEFEAEIACGHLKSAGIDATVVKDDAGGMFPSLQETEGVHLSVSQDQKENAMRVLGEKNIQETAAMPKEHHNNSKEGT